MQQTRTEIIEVSILTSELQRYYRKQSAFLNSLNDNNDKQLYLMINK